MSWRAEVKTREDWKPMSGPTGPKQSYVPYEFETAHEAAVAVRDAYPDQYRIDLLSRDMKLVRVVNVGTGEVDAAWRFA